MAPLLTVGLPCYNARPYLPEAIQSIFAQSFSDWELIIVDDGSTDESLEFLHSIQDPRVTLICDATQRGLAARLNQIVRLARGSYIARMDADDISHPLRLEKQVAFLLAHQEIDALGCGLVSFDRQYRARGYRRFPAQSDAICVDPLNGFQIAHATLCAKTEWFRRHPYNEKNRHCEDWELLYSSYRSSRFSNLPELLYLYREFESFSLSGYFRSKMHQLRLQSSQREDFPSDRMARMFCRSAVSVGAYSVACVIGLQDFLIRRRSRSLDDQMLIDFHQALTEVQATPLLVREAAAFPMQGHQ